MQTWDASLVFAGFSRLRSPRNRGPAEVPVDRDHPLMREWGVVCLARGHAACLADPAKRITPPSAKVCPSLYKDCPTRRESCS